MKRENKCNTKAIYRTIIASEETLLFILQRIMKKNELEIITIRKCNKGGYHIYIQGNCKEEYYAKNKCEKHYRKERHKKNYYKDQANLKKKFQKEINEAQKKRDKELIKLTRENLGDYFRKLFCTSEDEIKQ